jgi:hypothetical protein
VTGSGNYFNAKKGLFRTVRKKACRLSWRIPCVHRRSLASNALDMMIEHRKSVLSPVGSALPGARFQETTALQSRD